MPSSPKRECLFAFWVHHKYLRFWSLRWCLSHRTQWGEGRTLGSQDLKVMSCPWPIGESRLKFLLTTVCVICVTQIKLFLTRVTSRKNTTLKKLRMIMLEVPERTGTWISDESRIYVICFPCNNLPLQLWENTMPHSWNGTQNILFFSRMPGLHWTHYHKSASLVPHTGWREHLKVEDSFSGSATFHYDTADATSRTLFSRKVICVQICI